MTTAETLQGTGRTDLQPQSEASASRQRGSTGNGPGTPTGRRPLSNQEVTNIFKGHQKIQYLLVNKLIDPTYRGFMSQQRQLTFSRDSFELAGDKDESRKNK